MNHETLDDLLTTLEVRLRAFAVCEIGAEWRLDIDPLRSVVCHFVLRGRGYLNCADKRIPIAAGAILIVPPGTPKSISGPDPVTRAVSATESCGSYTDGLLAFRARADETALVLGCASLEATCGGSYGLFEMLKEPVVVSISDDGRFAWGFDALLQELTEPRLGARLFAECLMKQAVLLLFREQLNAGGRSALLEHLGDKRLVRTVVAMIKAPGEQHTIDSLASLSGMSRSSFMAHFARCYGKTPGEFLTALRMQTAARLLLTSEMPIKCLAAAVGYASRSQFSRTFRSAFGSDPSTYRAAGGAADAKDAPPLDNASAATGTGAIFHEVAI